jgi:histidinol-phosphatase (PHP family)
MEQIGIYTQEKVNLHTHSWYCGHGKGEMYEYAEQAVAQGLEVLGMSEHCPFPDHRWEHTRMPFSMRGRYLEDCRSVRDAFAPSLKMPIGFECDYLPEYESYYRDEILGTLGCDYLICSVHDLAREKDKEFSLFSNKLDKQDLVAYTDLYLKALQSGLFLFGAHPDLFAYNYRSWDAEAEACSRAIIECASSCSVPLEINRNGMRKKLVRSEDGNLRYAYPLERFWAMATEYPLKVVCNSDAHDPAQVNDRDPECAAFAAKVGIQYASYTIDRKESGGYGIRIG